MQSKNRTYQTVAVCALIIAVGALTIGFAAFSTNLTISSSAEVNQASDTLDVVFSTSANSAATGSVNGVASGTTGASGDAATLNGTTITGLKAKFTEPGQKVTYSFNTYNNSAFTAYLTSIAFGKAAGASGNETKVCTAGGNNPATTGVDAACNGISVKVTTGTLTATGSMAKTDIGTHSIASKAGETTTVEIEYAAGSDTADGDFTVAFGDITLGYSSVDQ